MGSRLLQCGGGYHATIGRSVTPFTLPQNVRFWPILLQKSVDVGREP